MSECQSNNDEEEDLVSLPNSSRFEHESLDELVLDDDPALQPKHVSYSERCAIVRKGPVQIETDFSKNPDGQRFTFSYSTSSIFW